MTTNPRTNGRRIEGWITQPPAHHGQPSEGHTSAVNVLRLVNTRHQHRASEPVPFRAQPPRLRSIRHMHASTNAPESTIRAHGCAGAGGQCHGHPDCPDRLCEGHPDNDTDATGEFSPKLRAVFWLVYLCVVALATAAAVHLSTH